MASRRAAAGSGLDALTATALELFAPLAVRGGQVRARRMFGGAGIYCEGVMFALLADGDIWLKADPVSLPHYQQHRCDPFVWAAPDGRRVTMSYRRLPPEALDDADQALGWGRLGLDSALRAARSAPTRRRALSNLRAKG